MSRSWVSQKDHRWVMLCDEPSCTTRSDARLTQDDHNLADYARKGWWIGLAVDACPSCVTKLGGLDELLKTREGHKVMALARITGIRP